MVADEGDEGDDAAVGGDQLLGEECEKGLPPMHGGVLRMEEFGSAFGVGDVAAEDDEVGVEGGDGAVHLFEEGWFLVGVTADDDADGAGELCGQGAEGVGCGGAVEREGVGGVGLEVVEGECVDVEATSGDLEGGAARGEGCGGGCCFVGECGGGLFVCVPLDGDGGGGVEGVGEVEG